MIEDMKLKILFRIPFTLYFLAIAELRNYSAFTRKRYLCIAVKEFMDANQKTAWYYTEISRHKHIDQL